MSPAFWLLIGSDAGCFRVRASRLLSQHGRRSGRRRLRRGSAGTPLGGAAYLILSSGRLSGEDHSLLQYADVILTGSISGEMVGTSVNGAGDVYGDGHPDLLIGAPERDGVGGAYLMQQPPHGR